MKGSRTERRKRRAARYFAGVRQDLPRSAVKEQVRRWKDPLVLVTSKRYIDYP